MAILFKKQKRNIFTLRQPLLFFSFVYFLFQSISVLHAVNISTFLNQYEKLTQTFIFFLVAFYLLRTRQGIFKKVIIIFLLSTFVNIVIQLLILINTSSTLAIMQIFLHPKVQDTISTNLARDRFSFEYYDEITIPLLLYLYFSNKLTKVIKPNKYIYPILIISILSIAFLSNIRSRFLIGFIAFIGFFLTLGKDLFIRIFFRYKYFLLIIVTSLVVLNLWLSYSNNYSVVDRFLLTDDQDTRSLDFRKNMINYAFNIGAANNFSGVGLGNFFEYLPSSVKNRSYQLVGLAKKFFDTSIPYTHNILAQTYVESGLFGFLSMILLLLYCITIDFFLLRQEYNIKKPIIVSFWSLFIYALFNTPAPLVFLSNFLILRILTEIPDAEI